MSTDETPRDVGSPEGTGSCLDMFVDHLKRNSEGAPCKCNGYADRQYEPPTQEEIKRYDCGRSYACCTAVFKCRLCGGRFIGGFESPEMDW